MNNEKIKIKEIIVVEGRDDITALKRVVDGHVIALNGFSGLTSKSIKRLVKLSENNDLVLLTDPDYAGKKIRSVVKEHIPHIKHAFISRKKATKKDNVGVENASDESIIEALSHIISEKSEDNNNKSDSYVFTMADLLDNGLCVGNNAKERRILLGDALNIGYYNSKQLLNALNSFNIKKEKFDTELEKINKENKKAGF